MNERIKELALKAGGGLSCIAEPLEHPWKFSEQELETFAELIVKECAAVIDEEALEDEVDFAMRRMESCSWLIKEHFGVR